MTDVITKDIGELSDGYHTFNELYDHRHYLFMALAGLIKSSWKSRKHNDGGSLDGWFVAGFMTPLAESVTYHLPDRLWGLCPGRILEYSPAWDGHTSQDVLDRLSRWVAGMAIGSM